MSGTWYELKRRQRAFTFWLIASPIVTAVVAMILVTYVGVLGAVIIPAVICGTGYMRAGERLSRWPCPRCQEPFSVNHHKRAKMMLPETGLVRHQCQHCGLQVGSPPSFDVGA